jgi:hypothetical protein
MEHAKTGLTLVGIVGIVDPPRDDIPFVVRTLRSAGIRVMMVTTVPCFDNCERYTKQLNRLLVTLP